MCSHRYVESSHAGGNDVLPCQRTGDHTQHIWHGKGERRGETVTWTDLDPADAS